MIGYTFLKRADGHEEFAVKFRAAVAVSRSRRRIITVNKVVGINYVFIEAKEGPVVLFGSVVLQFVQIKGDVIKGNVNEPTERTAEERVAQSM